MSCKPNDGGPAFPHHWEEASYDSREPEKILRSRAGMSLRDWFLGQAIAGIYGNSACDYAPKNGAALAAEIADALLAECEKAR